ncbi:MAG: hypothetical protein KGR46_07445 [Verrucomicrobia bacterium]|nr:hypothetical protein [Verrucomicrobiota bacterium]
MPANPPIDFEALARSGGSPATGGYPYTIKAADLMRNFVYASLDTDDSLVETTSGQGGHQQRRLKISPGTAAGQLAVWDGSRWVPTPTPTSANTMLLWNGTAWTSTPAPPSAGTHVLGSVAGQIQWMETEEC